jgi:hypothetical protein
MTKRTAIGPNQGTSARKRAQAPVDVPPALIERAESDMLLANIPSAVRAEQVMRRRRRREEFLRFVQPNNKGIDWLGLLEYVKHQHGFSEDRQLALSLAIPPSTLSAVKRGKAELSIISKMTILDHFGVHLIAEAIQMLSIDEEAAKARRQVQREALRPTAEKADQV